MFTNLFYIIERPLNRFILKRTCNSKQGFIYLLTHTIVKLSMVSSASLLTIRPSICCRNLFLDRKWSLSVLHIDRSICQIQWKLLNVIMDNVIIWLMLSVFHLIHQNIDISVINLLKYVIYLYKLAWMLEFLHYWVIFFFN